MWRCDMFIFLFTYICLYNVYNIFLFVKLHRTITRFTWKSFLSRCFPSIQLTCLKKKRCTVPRSGAVNSLMLGVRCTGVFQLQSSKGLSWRWRFSLGWTWIFCFFISIHISQKKKPKECSSGASFNYFFRWKVGNWKDPIWRGRGGWSFCSAVRFHDETFCPRCFGATCGCVWRKKNDPSFVFEKSSWKFPLVNFFPDLVFLQPLTGPEVSVFRTVFINQGVGLHRERWFQWIGKFTPGKWSSRVCF